MEVLAGWLVCGALASIWWMACVALNIGREADNMGSRLRHYPDQLRLLIMVASALLIFIAGPIGLADVIVTEIRKRRKNG